MVLAWRRMMSSLLMAERRNVQGRKPHQQAVHKTVPDQGMPKRQKELAKKEPSTQDTELMSPFGGIADVSVLEF